MYDRRLGCNVEPIGRGASTLAGSRFVPVWHGSGNFFGVRYREATRAEKSFPETTTDPVTFCTKSTQKELFAPD